MMPACPYGGLLVELGECLIPGRFVAMDSSRRPCNAPRCVTQWQLVCLRTFAPPRASFRSRKYESKGFTGREACLVLYEVRVKGIVELSRDEVQDAFFTQQSETLHLREHTLYSDPYTPNLTFNSRPARTQSPTFEWFSATTSKTSLSKTMISDFAFSFQWAPTVGMLSMMFLLSTRT